MSLQHAQTATLHAMDFSFWQKEESQKPRSFPDPAVSIPVLVVVSPPLFLPTLPFAQKRKRSANILLDLLTSRTTVLARRPPCPAGLAASGSPSGSARRWWRGTFASRRAAPPSGPRAAPAWPKPEKSVAVCQSARRPLRSSAA
eukprot:scaffold34816_cov65-Phaeocystis_antarctica.AAC.2